MESEDFTTRYTKSAQLKFYKTMANPGSHNTFILERSGYKTYKTESTRDHILKTDMP